MKERPLGTTCFEGIGRAGFLRTGVDVLLEDSRILATSPHTAADPCGELENDVQLVEIEPGYYCLSHSLRHSQVFGDSRLRDAVASLLAGREIPSALATTLREQGFLCPQGSDKNRMRVSLAEQETLRASASPRFTLLRVLLTDCCNLTCDYCKVVQNVRKPGHSPVSFARLTEVVEYFFTHSLPSDPRIIHCTGGEPLLHQAELEHLITEKNRLCAGQENCWLVVGTNATLVTNARARALGAAGAKCIVSMDGPPEVHNLLRSNRSKKGSWRLVDRGIQLLRSQGVEVSISIVFGSHNLPEADQIIEWMIERYQPTGLGVNFMKPPTPDRTDYRYLIQGQDYAETLYRIHQRWRKHGVFLELVHRKLDPFVNRYYRSHDCGAASGANLNLDARGHIGPCKSFLVMDRLAIRSLDPNDAHQAIIDKWRARSPIYYPSCAGCPALGVCGNGCAYDAYVSCGSEMAVDQRSCLYNKRFHELMLRDLFGICGGRPRADTSGWFPVATSERRAVMGAVAERANSLSYSIGHHVHQ